MGNRFVIRYAKDTTYNRFVIQYAKYPYNALEDYTYSTNSIIKFVITLIRCYTKYEIIDINIRNIKKEK